ncbi:MAG: GNAT family N-acetyltransferase [Lachnospiraceae bacterium]|nr:GNAT family N-acetyltransferase [Lachnospiraceae bacterium]
MYGRDKSGAGWLHWVAVRREYQGRGLAKPLISYVLSVMKDLGYTHAKIPTQTTTWVACKVYLDFGFAPVKENAVNSRDGWRIIKTLTNHNALSDFQTIRHDEMLAEKPTHAQCSIKHCIDMIAPFEASDEKVGEGQLQFYRFMTSIYREMYRDPEKYQVFSDKYEKYVENKQFEKIKKEKEHISDSRESTLRNAYQQAIQFYALFFYYLGLRSQGADEKSCVPSLELKNTAVDKNIGALIVSKEDYADVLSQMGHFHESQYNEQRFKVLEELGIRTLERQGNVEILHTTYTKAMEGLRYLCNAPESKYKLMNYLRLDYKNAYAPIPGVEDICRTLPAESVRAVKALENALQGLKIKAKIRPLRGIVSDFKWKVEYSYKSKNICGFYADSEYLMLCIYFNHFENINGFAQTLYDEDKELFGWFKDQFPERACKCPSNRRVSFAGEMRRICGLSNRAEIVNPDTDDVEKALYILKKYRNISV